MEVSTTLPIVASQEQEEQQSMVRKVALASFLGNFIEWFDYASYSYLATIIAAVFFPASNATVALIQTFAIFALSFLLRPIGALFWGNFGDKHGRKRTLSISIILMSGATFLIGCLPSYSIVGLAAPLLLLFLRMVQSFSASGEYAGAATFLGEYAPTSKRGLYCSLIPASTAIGLLAGSSAIKHFKSARLGLEITIPSRWASRRYCLLHPYSACRFSCLRIYDRRTGSQKF